jgi:hypothetical protein
MFPESMGGSIHAKTEAGNVVKKTSRDRLILRYLEYPGLTKEFYNIYYSCGV